MFVDSQKNMYGNPSGRACVLGRITEEKLEIVMS